MKRLWLKRIVWGVTLVAMTAISASVGRIGSSATGTPQEGNRWVVRGAILLLAVIGVLIAGLRARRQRG